MKSPADGLGNAEKAATADVIASSVEVAISSPLYLTIPISLLKFAAMPAATIFPSACRAMSSISEKKEETSESVAPLVPKVESILPSSLKRQMAKSLVKSPQVQCRRCSNRE